MRKTFAEKRFFKWQEDDVSVSLRAKSGSYGGGSEVLIITEEDKMSEYIMATGQAHAEVIKDKCCTLNCVAENPILFPDERSDAVESVVRRLTPLECERLQGMPDDWSKYGVDENGKVFELSDSARYRLQGNGIATPFWKYLLKRISAQYERDPTLGSLFDGQGSFPMLWENINGPGTAVWCSEIDKNAIAVCKYHFPESA